MSILHDIVPVNKLTIPEFRDWITNIEKRMVESTKSFDRHDESQGISLKHIFTKGLYTREIFMPAGSLVISKIHLFEHPFIVSKGVVSVYDGLDITLIEAPFMRVTPPGTKRILYVHEDTTWTTFHVTDSTTFEEVDVNGVITCDSFEEFELLVNKELAI